MQHNTIIDTIEQTVTGSVEKTLGCLGIPTSTDVRNLTDKVEQLTKKVEKLAENLQH